MKVIYIVGASHSGSTLLDMMLNAHPEIVSVGEVLNLNRVKRRKSGEPKVPKCSCGAVGILQCSFWSRVNARVKEISGKGFADLDLYDYRQPGRMREANEVLFGAIADVSGKNIIVDSSKMPRRLKHLLQLEHVQVHPIFVVRDPRGQINSSIGKHGLMKSIFFHEVVHAQIRRTLGSVPHSFLRYEDLVLRPERSLDKVLRSLGLKFDERQLKWAEQEKHSFAGNHARFQPTSKLVLDDSWRSGLSATQKVMIDIGTLYSRRLTLRLVEAGSGSS
jgi:hypothetical protein